MTKFIFPILYLVVCVSAVSASNLPRSQQATLVESVSPTEVVVRATGIGYWEKGDGKKKDLDNYLLEQALDDARKAAVWFILFGGTDPLLKNPPEKTAFIPMQEEFFDIANVKRFIAWESPDLIDRRKREIKKNAEYELTIEKVFKVNKQLLQDELNQRGILSPPEEIAEALGNPFIMVIPAVIKGENPLELLQTNPNISHAAKVIEGYLTARQYDVVVPEQQAALNALTAAQGLVKGIDEDPSYALALSIGSDVYITYEITIESASFNTKKAVVNVRAYETTTARLLGTETGYSPTASASEKALIENAVNDAIDKVIARINEYWKKDIQKGIQYRVIVSLTGNFSSEEVEEIQMTFLDAWDRLTKNKNYKDMIVTANTLDYIIWCDPAQFRQSTRLYQKIKLFMDTAFQSGKTSQININRKMLLLKIEKI